MIILAFAAFLVLLRVVYSIGEMICERDLPRNTIWGLFTALALFCLCAPAFGQAVREDVPLQTTGPDTPMPNGNLPQALWLANSTVQVCAHPVVNGVCLPIATYNDSNKDAICPPTAPLTQLPGFTCTASTGSAANVGFWYAGGIIDYLVTSPYGSFGPFTISQGLPGTGSFVSTTETSPQSVSGQLNTPTLGNQAGNVLIPPAVTGYTGTDGTKLMLGVGTFTPGDCLDMSANLSVQDAGQPCPVTSGTGISGLTANYLPLGATATTISGNSHIDDGATTTGTVTISEPVTIGGAFNLPAQGTATSSNNYANFSYFLGLSYWNGTASVSDQWTQNTFLCAFANCGATPTTNFDIIGPATLAGTGMGVEQNPALAATSGSNTPTPSLFLRGYTWNGTTSIPDDWSLVGTFGTGTSPTANLTLSKPRGTTGAATFTVAAGMAVTGGTPGIQLTPAAFATYGACNSGAEGTEEAVTNSTTNTWGATVTGGGTSHIKMYCDGTQWTVEAK